VPESRVESHVFGRWQGLRAANGEPGKNLIHLALCSNAEGGAAFKSRRTEAMLPRSRSKVCALLYNSIPNPGAYAAHRLFARCSARFEI